MRIAKRVTIDKDGLRQEEYVYGRAGTEYLYAQVADLPRAKYRFKRVLVMLTDKGFYTADDVLYDVRDPLPRFQWSRSLNCFYGITAAGEEASDLLAWMQYIMNSNLMPSYYDRECSTDEEEENDYDEEEEELRRVFLNELAKEIL